MNFLERVLRLFGRKDQATSASKQTIPNGWGRQVYEKEAQDVIYEEPVDLRNIEQKHGWIRAFLAKRIEGLNPKLNKKWRYPYTSLTYTFEER